MIQPHICGGKTHTAILPSWKFSTLHVSHSPSSRCSAFMNGSSMRISGVWISGPKVFSPFRAEKVSPSARASALSAFLCPAAENDRTADPAEKQHRHKDRPEQCSLHRKKANGTAHCAGQPHQKPCGRPPLYPCRSAEAGALYRVGSGNSGQEQGTEVFTCRKEGDSLLSHPETA